MGKLYFLFTGESGRERKRLSFRRQNVVVSELHIAKQRPQQVTVTAEIECDEWLVTDLLKLITTHTHTRLG